MGFGLSDLGSALADQFLQGENSLEQRSLKDEFGNEYGKLGDFAKQIDQTAQRNYLEEGYLNNNFNNPFAKMTEVIMQQPEATVIVRKKMFTSLANNYAPEYMNEEERLVYLAMDKLFSNKAKQISAYEKLCKIQKASQKMGEVDEQLLPIIIGLNDTLSSTVDVFSSSTSSLFGGFGDTVRKIKAVYNYSKSNFYTTWIEDVLTPASLRYASGTGAMEFTSFYSIATNVGLTPEGNTLTITFDDPYNLMMVSTYDIENAISDVVNINNSFGNKFGADSSISMGKEIAGDLVTKNIEKLNSVRAARGASPISFKIDPNTIYGRKVIAIVDSLGQEIPFNAKNVGIPWSSGVEVEDPYLYGGASLGVHGLSTEKTKNLLGKYVNTNLGSSSEKDLFGEVVSSIFTKINLDKNTERQYDFLRGDKNDLVNYVRKKLTFYFAGKCIIQPMDVINVYISSKTNVDGKIMSGVKEAFSGFGLMNNFSNQMQQLAGSFSGLFSPSENLDLQMEKSAILGQNNVPNYIWLMLREHFVAEKEGCHVYAGIIDKSTINITDSSYNITCTASDNCKYLSLSMVNFSPGAANSTGKFFDPLTIFKTKFDSVYNEYEDPPLLDENEAILADTNHPLKINAGPKLGKIIADGKIPSEVEFTTIGYSPSGDKVIYAPDGLVYKWKEGIQTFEARGSSSDISSSNVFSEQSASTEALANQDVMNCVSLLVTGTPYNYYTYFKAGVDSGGNLTVDRNKGTLTSSRLTRLQEAIARNNLIWGNFIPYKSLSVSSQQFSEMMSIKNQNLIKSNTALNKLYKEVDQLKTSLVVNSLNLQTGEYDINAISERYKTSLDAFNTKITKAQVDFIQSISDPNFSNFSMIGNDLIQDVDYFVNNGADDPSVKNKRQIRRKSNFLTRRLSWQVRQNSDSNLFIVDDSYDKNNDLLAFENNVNSNNIKLFSNDLSNVLDKIKAAAAFLNMEFYADTQGHLRIRAPQYNKMPSSVFLSLLRNKKSKKNVQIFPKFLNNLLLDQLNNLYKKVCGLEDEIRLFCIILGIGNTLSPGGDAKAISHIRGTEVVNNAKSNKKDFKFVTNCSNGNIVDFGSIQFDLNDLDEGLTKKSFLDLKLIKEATESQLNLKNTFDIASRVNKFQENLNSILKNESDVGDQLTTLESNRKDIETLVARIFEKTGEIIKPEKYLDPTSSENDLILNQIILPKIYAINSFEINQIISKKILERQKIIKQLYYYAKSSYEFNALDNEELAVQFLTNPNSQDLPEIFDFLIEDESYDDLGPGSGSRYVIKNSQIISCTLNETAPDFTSITVTGRLAKNFPNENIKSDWKPLPGGGNPLTSSSALDYDMWKMYGYKVGQEKSYPLLTDPESQTTPMAVALLMQQRKKIFTASLTIVGNEYMQPGEVIYIEQLGMLFYVTKVNHTFNYAADGGQFQTILTLEYGHAPGEYIPNLTDFVGKMLFVNRDKCTTSIRKGASSVAGQASGALAMIDMDLAKNFEEKNPILKNNIKTINQVASDLRKEIVANSDPNLKTVLNILVYKSKVYSNSSKEFANEIRKILLGISTHYKIQNTSFTPFTQDQVLEVQEVNLSDKNEKRGPSIKAFGVAGNLISQKMFPDKIPSKQSALSSAQLRNKYICNFVVDFYIKTYPK